MYVAVILKGYILEIQQTNDETNKLNNDETKHVNYCFNSNGKLIINDFNIEQTLELSY